MGRSDGLPSLASIAADLKHDRYKRQQRSRNPRSRLRTRPPRPNTSMADSEPQRSGADPSLIRSPSSGSTAAFSQSIKGASALPSVFSNSNQTEEKKRTKFGMSSSRTNRIKMLASAATSAKQGPPPEKVDLEVCNVSHTSGKSQKQRKHVKADSAKHKKSSKPARLPTLKRNMESNRSRMQKLDSVDKVMCLLKAARTAAEFRRKRSIAGDELKSAIGLLDNLKATLEHEAHVVDHGHQVEVDPTLDKADKDVLDWINAEYLVPHSTLTKQPRHQLPPTVRLKSRVQQMAIADGMWKAMAMRKSMKNIKDSSLHLAKMTIANKAKECLLKSLDWSFDVFELEAVTNGNPILTLGVHFMEGFHLQQSLDINGEVFAEFLLEIQKGYLDIPYHNRIHAADVLANTAFFMTCKRIRNSLSDITRLSVLVAAIIHDFRHPGTNNGFQIQTNSELSVLFNDRSVLENFSCTEAFKLLKNPRVDFLERFSCSDRRAFRHAVIGMVLSTDMVEHVHHIDRLEASEIFSQPKDQTITDYGMLDSCLKAIVHASDIANPCKHLEISKMWTERAISEFYAQGDKERELGLPVSLMMNREDPHVPQSQIGFIDYVVRPLFDLIAAIFPEAQQCLDAIDENRAYWECQVQLESKDKENGSADENVGEYRDEIAQMDTPPE